MELTFILTNFLKYYSVTNLLRIETVSNDIVQIISLPGTDGQKPLQISEVHTSNISAHMRKYF